MKVENLEAAKSHLTEAFLELEDSIEDTDSEEDASVENTAGKARTLQSFIGELDILIVKLKRNS